VYVLACVRVRGRSDRVLATALPLYAAAVDTQRHARNATRTDDASDDGADDDDDASDGASAYAHVISDDVSTVCHVCNRYDTALIVCVIALHTGWCRECTGALRLRRHCARAKAAAERVH
jgi:hypothetical protein